MVRRKSGGIVQPQKPRVRSPFQICLSTSTKHKAVALHLESLQLLARKREKMKILVQSMRVEEKGRRNRRCRKVEDNGNSSIRGSGTAPISIPRQSQTQDSLIRHHPTASLSECRSPPTYIQYCTVHSTPQIRPLSCHLRLWRFRPLARCNF